MGEDCQALAKNASARAGLPFDFPLAQIRHSTGSTFPPGIPVLGGGLGTEINEAGDSPLSFASSNCRLSRSYE